MEAVDKKVVQLYGGKVELEFREFCHRYYVKNEGEEKASLKTGVTTFLGVLNKPALIPWAVGKAIDYISDEWKKIESGEVKFEDLDVNEILYNAEKAHTEEKDLAGEMGTAIHKWVEDYIKTGEVPNMPSYPDDAEFEKKVIQGVNAFLTWVEENDVKFIASEKFVYSKDHDFVGTLDIVAEIDGELYVLDLKTSNGVYDEMRLQVAAYLKADEEESGVKYKGRWILRLSKETEEEYYEKAKVKNAKREKKGLKTYEPAPYQLFEAVYLDEDENDLQNDFEAFLQVMNIFRWQKMRKDQFKAKK
ncbi:MAG: PD-(D/E)XK nuclease family protein [Proteobacteria bacterium]|jgi:hypothetical protein|nr:PD-(D/E)XK nuclease family protein [Pseudomonadota bacterium]